MTDREAHELEAAVSRAVDSLPWLHRLFIYRDYPLEEIKRLRNHCRDMCKRNNSGDFGARLGREDLAWKIEQTAGDFVSGSLLVSILLSILIKLFIEQFFGSA